MKKFTTLGGSLLLVWLLFPPVIAFALFANYYDRLLAHGINLLSLLALSYLFFGLVGVLLMQALRRQFLVSDAETTPQALMVGIVLVANMFGAGLEVVLKNDLYPNPLIAFVVYPGLFLAGSVLLAWVWERSMRLAAICAAISCGLFAILNTTAYFNIPMPWVLLCLSVIAGLFRAKPPIAANGANATNIRSQD